MITDIDPLDLYQRKGINMGLLSIERFMGFGIFVELLPNRVTDTLVETAKTEHDIELWLFGRVYVVISNEKAYDAVR
jgi:hypothetical protein